MQTAGRQNLQDERAKSQVLHLDILKKTPLRQLNTLILLLTDCLFAALLVCGDSRKNIILDHFFKRVPHISL